MPTSYINQTGVSVIILKIYKELSVFLKKSGVQIKIKVVKEKN